MYIHSQDWKKRHLFEHRYREDSLWSPWSVDTDCVKTQEITKLNTEDMAVVPCVMQTAWQKVSALVLARFYAPLQYQEQVCWIYRVEKHLSKEISGRDALDRASTA